ncbi:MAG: histidine kinase dimerization/phospho-acceptor domain-containing protein, partial [Rubrobacteraceae bacterium]
MFRTLRWRLTFWYGAGAVALLVLFALIPVTFYANIPSSLRPDPISTTRSTAKSAQRILEKTGSPSLVIETIQEPYVWVIVRDKQGHALAFTPGAEDLPEMNLPANSYPEVRRKREYAATALKSGGSGETIEVYAGEPLSNDPFLRSLVLFEVVGLLVGLVLMVGLGPTLAAAALKPLRRVSEVAEELRRGRLESRVDLPELKSRNDEVGQVAASFDAMAESLEELFDAEHESRESMRRFVADASHELRTPLTSILGYLDVLDEGGDRDPDVRRRAYAAMKIEGGRMTNLVEDLLTLARLESRQEIHADLVDIVALARDIAGGYPGRRIEVAADGPVELAAEPRVLR